MVDCGTFSYPTYMVGGSSLGIVGRFFLLILKQNLCEQIGTEGEL